MHVTVNDNFKVFLLLLCIKSTSSQKILNYDMVTNVIKVLLK